MIVGQTSARQARLARYRAARQRVSPGTSMAAFEALVAEALDALPAYARERLENVAVVVEERASPERLAALGFDPRQHLLGLYEGTNRLERGGAYHLVLPDRITLFRQPILDQVGTADRSAVLREVQRTVIHEIAHHFGYTDAELARLERR